jgi:hypothetical protein
MENHIIIKEDGSRLPWKKNRLNKDFCLLYHDNNQKYIFTPQANLKCQLFMIGGGGAGGYYFGGGGGAGAAYINNNFTFEQGKTYTFSIGTGGSCDIRDFNKLFKSGLYLNVYNNTSPNLNKISFNYDDYSSLGITSSGIMQSFIVNNITINQSIFNTNTTYIWSGYIKSTINDNNKIATVKFNSKIKSIMWFDTYHYNNENSFISTSGESNFQEVKVLNLDPNKYYNVKIIAYNYDTSNNANFDIKFENCEFYNYNKNFENYNVVPATDTSLTYKTVSTNDNNIILCKGGGTGGFGLYNQNKELNGGCGGGSGINKIKGVSINNNPIYNGTDGAVGNYCGGGGGIISPGNNNNGGEGKILNWFDEKLLFGAGGNGAGANEKRNLGYGCGGNGGDCCYFSKSIINNNGNNGCILIYISDVIENFSLVNMGTDKNHINNPTRTKSINYLQEYDDSIAAQLISDSFKIADYNNNSIPNGTGNQRADYFKKGLSFSKLAVVPADGLAATYATALTSTDNNDMHNFIYDVLVISKIYAVSYRLLYHLYTVTYDSDITKFATFMALSKIKFTTGNTESKIDEATNAIILNNIFLIDNLNIGIATNKTAYEAEGGIYIKPTGNTPVTGSPNISKRVFDASIEDICGTNKSGFHMPLYHKDDGAIFNGLKLFADNATSNINKITNGGTLHQYTYTNTSTTAVTIGFTTAADDSLEPDDLTALKNAYETNTPEGSAGNKQQYKYARILLYLEAFNTILNTNAYVSLLPTIKFQMYNYNAIIYNVLIQYQIFWYQNELIKFNPADAAAQTLASFAAPTGTGDGGAVTIITNLKTNINTDITNCKANLDIIIARNINTPNNITDTINEMVDIINTGNNTADEFKTSQNKLNEIIAKYNNEFDKNNNYLYYYKIIIIIALFLILIIFFIYTLNSIDNNTKIGIYIFILLFIIILLAYYGNNFTITENFIVAKNIAESNTLNIYADSTAAVNYNLYKTSLNKFNNSIIKIITNATINKNMLFPIKIFTGKANNVRNNKIEFYNLKKINLENGIDILKKSSNNYYYFIILIIITTIILLFSLIFLLLNSNMLIQIIAIAAIFEIILIFYISYNINKRTRLAENKNYWANYNPSKTTLDSL